MAEVVSFESLSAVFKKQVVNLRKPVAELAKGLGVVRAKTKTLAPEVMGVYGKLTGEYPGLSFVDFARLIDSTIPTFAADRDGATGYRNHPTYYALTYMRRIAQTEGNREGRKAGGAARGGGVRDSATDALARSLKTILQIVKEPESVWAAVQSEFGFTERLMNRLRKRVEETKPLFTLPTKAVQIGTVIKMQPKPAAAPSAEPSNLVREGGTRKRSAA